MNLLNHFLIINTFILELSKDSIRLLERAGFYNGGYWFHKTGVVRKAITYYRCVSHSKTQCTASLKLLETGDVFSNIKQHNHPKPSTSKGYKINLKYVQWINTLFYSINRANVFSRKL